MPNNRRKPRPRIVIALRLRSEEQRDLIQKAAAHADTSMNALIRVGAEKYARELLGLAPAEAARAEGQ